MGKKSKHIFYLLTLIAFPLLTEAKTDSPAAKFLGTAAGYTYGGLRDYGISPLYYGGHHITGEAGYYLYKDSILFNIEAGFSHGTVRPSIYPGPDGSKMKSIKAGADINYMRYAGSIGERAKIFAGGIMVSRFGFYEHNNLMNSAKTNYIYSTINAGGKLTREIDAGSGRYMLLVTVDVPVLAFITRPAYSYIKPEGFLNHNTGNIRSFFSSIEISSINRFTGIGTNVEIERKLSNGNTVRLGYSWEFFDHKNSNRLKSALHGITIKKFFSL